MILSRHAKQAGDRSPKASAQIVRNAVVRLMRREANTLHIANVDVLDGLPLLDIKLYVPAFDQNAADSVAWLEQANSDAHKTAADDRLG